MTETITAAEYRTTYTTEYDLHLALAEYVRLQYPDALFHSDLSGVPLHPKTAGKIKALQSGRGWPDFQIAVKNGKFAGFFLEIKTGKGKVYRKNGQLLAIEHVQEQAAVLECLRQQGYWAGFGCGWDECRRLVDWYMEMKG